MAKSKSKYDYIGVRVSAEERRFLETMVGSSGITSLSDAVRKLAFDQSNKDRDLLNRYLREINEAHQALNRLIRSGGIKGAALSRLADAYTASGIEDNNLEDLAGQVVALEADVFAMEREVQRLVTRSAKLSREIRRVI